MTDSKFDFQGVGVGRGWRAVEAGARSNKGNEGCTAETAEDAAARVFSASSAASAVFMFGSEPSRGLECRLLGLPTLQSAD